MKNGKMYIITSVLLIMLFLAQNVVLATDNNISKFTLGVFQASHNVLKGDETTMTVVLSHDANNPRQINITGVDTTYNFVSLKWIKGYIEVEDIAVFETASATTIEITEGKTISASFEIESAGQYSVLARNSNGDGFIARITTIIQDVPTMTVTKDESNPLKVTIVAKDGEENIVRLKVAKKSTKDEEIDFETQGTEISITPAQTVTVEYTFDDNGIYAINARDTSGNTFTKTVYIYKEFPVTTKVTATDKVLSIASNAILSDIVQIKVIDNQTKEETELDIEPGREVATIYVSETYGNYTIHVIDELGFKSETNISLIEEVTLPTITYTPAQRTNGSVTATITFDKEGVTITNNNAQNTYTFTQNGTFTFEYTTKAGTAFTKQATVNWIEAVDIEKNYRIMEIDSNKYIKKIPVTTTVEEFLTNINVIDANYKIYDPFDNSTAKATPLGTAMKLKSDNETYTLIVTGDINSDSKLSSTDISQLKLHLVDATRLRGANYEAADMNLNDNVTLTDLSQMKAKLVDG